jgi:hypothetical protein
LKRHALASSSPPPRRGLYDPHCRQRLAAALSHLPARNGGVNERIYLAAASYGRLALQGNCLGMTGSGGGFATVVWPYTASLGRDARGLFVTDTDSGAKLRLGDWMIFGSGPTDGDTAYDSPLSEPVSAECRNRMIALSPGFDKHRRP